VSLKEGNIYDLFATFGINAPIIRDVLSRPPFSERNEGRKGEYIGLSQRMKDLIVLSMKIALSFQKAKVTVEDLILAFFRIQTENWFYQMLDFVGISPKDFEGQVVNMNALMAKSEP
jgi:hypothetical protein